MRVIGEAQQQWAPLRRKYNLFLHRDDNTADQFAHVNEPFLSWDFSLRGEDGSLVGSVNRNFSGLARELFADVGVYVLQMDSAQPDANEEGATATPSMTLDQRAVMLATAVSIDFDYFSRSRGGMGFMPLWMIGGGEGAGVGTAGAAGAEAAGVGAAAGAEAAGVGVATAGAAAGMGAMRGGMGGVGEQPPSQPEQNSDWDEWDGDGGGGGGGTGEGGSSGDAGVTDPEIGVGGEGGSAADVISDFFGL
jgi:hypothetical protein